MTTEQRADIRGEKLSRDERKALRTADLRGLDFAGLSAMRAEATKAILHLVTSHERQQANGLPVTDERLRRNCASHHLTLECIDAILHETAGIPVGP